MNVYDFDGTIYRKDSSVEFYKYCLRQDRSVLKALPTQAIGVLLYLMSFYDKKRLKESFFSFLKYVPDVELYLANFWAAECKDMCFANWYLEKHMDTDVIISASPSFLVKQGAKVLNVENVIASEVDPKTGMFLANNCKGDEKVERFTKIYGDEKIDEFYSDSLSDTPMAKVATKAYFIDNGTIFAWDFNKKKSIDFIESFRYIFWGGVTTLINFLLFILFLKLGIHYTVSNIVTYFIAVVISYFCNKRFVFKRENNNPSICEFFKFITIRILSISIETFMLWVLVDIIKGNVYASKIGISIAVIIGTYILNKLFVFAGKE